METQQIDHRAEEHGNFITDIRFRVGTTQLATSSSDGTVRLWNAAEVIIFRLYPFWKAKLDWSTPLKQ
jgi:WD40 repeat protein